MKIVLIPVWRTIITTYNDIHGASNNYCIDKMITVPVLGILIMQH